MHNSVRSFASLQKLFGAFALLAGLGLVGTVAAQTVTSVSNNLVNAGDDIIVNGSGLASVSQVLLDGQPLMIAAQSNSAMTVQIPIGASSGYLRVIANAGSTQTSALLTTARIRVKRASSSGIVTNNATISMPSVSGYSTPVVADLDMDGRIDLLVGDENGEVWCFEQKANNTFPTAGTLLTSTGSTGNGNGLPVTNYAKPALTDIDGDGKLDLLVGTGTGRNIMRFEQLAGTSNRTAFGPGQLLTTNGVDPIQSGGNYPKPAITDLNGNGLLDLLVGDDSGQLARYEQLSATGAGAAQFAARGFLKDNANNAIDVGGTAKPLVVDWDGNGLLDIVVGNSQGYVLRYEQAQANSTAFNSLGYMKNGTNNLNVGSYAAPAVTDLDGNGRMDLLVGGNSGSVQRFEQGTAAPVTPLPVVLSAFEGHAAKGGNQLSWATAQELNSARFVVEASATGDAYSALGTVAAAGTSTSLNTYLYLDASDAGLRAGRRYYRLRLEDADGRFTYSPVIVVGRAAMVGAETKTDFYPNPFADKLLVALPGYAEPQAATVTLNTLTGRPVYEAKMSLGAGPQALPGLPELPAGVYLLRLSTPAGISTHKVTRQ